MLRNTTCRLFKYELEHHIVDCIMIKWAVTAALLALCVVASEEGRDEGYTYRQICLHKKRLVLLHGSECRHQVALGRWQNTVNTTGWTMLEVETKGIVEPEVQAYAAGYLEGVLSRTLINYYIHNMYEPYCRNHTQFCGRLDAFLGENQKWIESQLELVPDDDLYWGAVNRTYHQISGLIDGYEGRPIVPRIIYDLHPIYYINMNGDFYDLERKLKRADDPETPRDHCSGFVKVAPGNNDLFVSQVVMGPFQNMLRVLKLYKFDYESDLYPGHGTSFSSYPGLLYSCDDFALMTSGLAVIETTITLYDTALFHKVRPTGQLLSWVRAIVANQLARGAREWCEIFSRYNSGTYNNQWLIVDYKLFKPGQSLPPFGLFYVLEQLPGKVKYGDMTSYLEKHSYFPSYNLPYFNDIAKAGGFIEQAEKIGDWYRWGKSARARIFERDHDKVTDLSSLATLMRYNDYTNDPLSACKCTPPFTAEAAISPRGDLNIRNGTYEIPAMGHLNHGALDYKASTLIRGTNNELARRLSFRAIGGPTHTNVPVFRWSSFDFDVPHVGHPEQWKFDEIEMYWEVDVHMP
ncbi:hypothetical protein PRIPAC_80881, partial [Pristionchus pacificus]|uniref:Phospholipase B-like n=1 Tax=Pristionchus pacificus TaxID=54126 RepID=A0A2A6CJF1_PRIPA